MSEMRKATEAAQAATPFSTPTKSRVPSLTPVPIPGVYTPRKVIPSLTPVPIPGVYTPRKVIPSQPWTAKDPFNKPAPPNGTPNSARYGIPSASSQPPKGILKTPDPERFSGGKGARSGSHGKSKNRNSKTRMPAISWSGSAKRGHGSS